MKKGPTFVVDDPGEVTAYACPRDGTVITPPRTCPKCSLDCNEEKWQPVDKRLEWTVRTETRTYSVTKTTGGNWACSCPGFTIGGKCRHLEQVQKNPGAPRPCPNCGANLPLDAPCHRCGAYAALVVPTKPRPCVVCGRQVESGEERYEVIKGSDRGGWRPARLFHEACFEKTGYRW